MADLKPIFGLTYTNGGIQIVAKNHPMVLNDLGKIIVAAIASNKDGWNIEVSIDNG